LKKIKVILIASSFIILTSCSTLNTTQTKSYQTACIAFDSIVSQINTAIEAHKIDLKTALKLQPIINSTAPFCENNTVQNTNSTQIINKILNATKELNDEYSRH